MTLGEIIKEYREIKGLSQGVFAESAEPPLSKAYISVLERNINPKTGEPPIPTLKTINATAAAMACTFEDIFDRLDADMQISLTINMPGGVVAQPSVVPAAAVAAAERILTKLPMYEVPVSAGTGAWLADGYEYEFVEFEDAPHDADYALRVRGDSMEPMYSDGDTVFVRTNIMVESGQVGVFVLNGEGYMKMLQGNRLVSMNPKYKPMAIEEWDEFWVAGRVVGKVTQGKEL